MKKSVALCGVMMFCVSMAFAGELVPVGLEKQLLVDDYVIAETTNITRALGTVTKRGSVIEPDRSWENIETIGSYLTVSYDASISKFRMWYMVGKQGVGYAESVNGIDWSKPNIGFNNSNNIVFDLSNSFSCSIDPHETDPQHRYKAAYKGPGTRVALAHSSDGINWTSYNGGAPVSYRAADTHNQILWDPLVHTYRLYTRTDYDSAGGYRELRGTRVMTNPNIKADPTHWTVVREWKFDREGEEERWRRQIYALTDTAYETIHFANMTVFEFPPRERYAPTIDHTTRHEENVLNYYIGTSRDGDHWDLHWVYSDKPMIPRGPDGSWDKDMIKPASQIVTWQDQHWLYYYGANERHGLERQAAIGLATLPLDRFICQQAEGTLGAITTKPFKLEGDTLQVNVDAQKGRFHVEVLDAEGKPIPGFTANELNYYGSVDELRLQPQWNSNRDLSSLKGRIICLKFYLYNAKLYAFQVKQ